MQIEQMSSPAEITLVPFRSASLSKPATPKEYSSVSNLLYHSFSGIHVARASSMRYN